MELDPFKLERTQQRLAAAGLDAALFTDFYNVAYLTGYAVPLEHGPNPFTRGFAAAVFMPERVTLVAERPADQTTAGAWSGVTVPYAGYSFRGPSPAPTSAIETVCQVAVQELPRRGSVGVELAHLPAAIWTLLNDLLPEITWVDLPPSLMLHVRAVKSPQELERLRACARLAEVGQAAARRLLREPGLSEIQAYSQVKAAMEQHVGRRFALQSAFHGGRRSADPFDDQPTDRTPSAGDLLICDLVPCLDGYWGDSCSTYVVGGAAAVTARHRELHRLAGEAFQRGFDAIRPGVTGGAIDAVVRGYLREHGYEYAHHTGHGVGVSNHEEPRLVIDNDTRLEPDMICLMEPGVYVPGYGGVRLERMVRVTATGAELLAHNSFDPA